MSKLWCAVAALLLATGCTATINGTVVPAPDLAPRPLTGSKVMQVLLDGKALSKLLNQPMRAAPPFPPVFGGSEKLVTRYGLAAPADCVGVVYMTHRNAYRSAAVTNVAGELWPADASGEVSAVQEGIVSLATAADARALFARFSEQWKQCEGKTVTVPSGLFVHNDITDVRVMDSVAAATVTLQPRPHSVLASVPDARAVGVAGNCLVEVEVAFIGTSDPGSAAISTSAIKIAQALMDKVRALS